jgi:hypothetical protein
MMNKVILNRARIAIASVCSLFVLVLFTACAGVPNSGTTGNGGTNASSPSTITGTVLSVNAQAHSVTLNVGGQQFTVNGLTDQQVTILQSQVGKTFTIQGTQSGTNSYTIASGTDPRENDNAAQGVATPTTTSNGASVPGSIDFTGTVQSISSSSITVSMPDGQGLSMNINAQTQRPDNGVMPSQGQLVKATAIANTADGSFTASKFDIAKSSDGQDQPKVTYQGVTTSAVGSDGKLNFKVGNKSFSYQIAPGADLHHFNNNSAQSITSGMTVKAKVLFNGSTGTVQSVDPANGND